MTSSDLRRTRVNIVTASDIVGVTTRTIRRWVADNRVEFVLTPGGRIRIYLDTLLKPSPKPHPHS